MSLSPFDQEFDATALPQIYAEFGEVMSYTPPGGSLVEGVLVILDQEDDSYDPGRGAARIKVTRTAATVQVADAKLVAAGIKPGKNGVFGRVQGRSLKIDSAPREKSREWVLDLVEIPG